MYYFYNINFIVIVSLKNIIMKNFKKFTIVVLLIMVCSVSLSGVIGEQAPIITEHSAFVRGYVNTKKSMHACATGYPFPESWVEKDGKMFVPDEGHVITNDGSKVTLTIMDVALEDAGIYTFHFENMFGEVQARCQFVVEPID